MDKGEVFWDEWECDAPQFIDFVDNVDDPNADAWFDERAQADGVPVPESADANDDSVYYETEDSQTASKATDASETTDCDTTDTERGTLKRRRSVRVAKNADATEDSERCGTPVSKRSKQDPVVKKKGVLRTEPFPTTSKGRRSTPASQRRGAAHSHSRRSTPASNRRSQSGRVTKKPPVMPVHKLTMPKTPGVLKRPNIKASLKLQTSEELEVEEIKRLRKEAEKTRKMAQKSLQQIHTGTAPVRPVMHPEPTRPVEFHFQTDSRIKNHNMETRLDNKHPDHKTDKPLKLTVPKPFHLHESKKNQDGGYQFKSDAEKLIAFQKDTPERFRTRSKNKPPSPVVHRGHKLTVAKTPNLETRTRKRQVTVISKNEQEEQEAQEMKRYKFRAHPVNQSIFQNPNQGVHKVATKEPTVPIEFDLSKDNRSQERVKPDEEEYEFHAQPVPKKILRGVVGVPKALEQQMTIPQSPAFALKKRLTRQLDISNEEKDDQSDRVIKANPVPHLGISFQPKLEHKYTVPAPFSFAAKDKERFQAKEENIKKIIEEESKVPEFHAQPVPLASPELPEKSGKPSTRPEPFNLHSVMRGARQAEEWSRKVEEELKQQRAQAQFKARPATVTKAEPFIPQRSNRTLTEVSEFELNTERRAVERQVVEEVKKEKQQEMDEIELERKRQREEEEKAGIARLREELVHKAKPVRQYKPTVIHPSDKPLTAAESPRFSDRLAYKKARV